MGAFGEEASLRGVEIQESEDDQQKGDIKQRR